jgi:ABC-2 type transport system ATP-binding protein
MVAVLKTEGLTKHFGALRAVEDLNLVVEEGDIFGFLGLNGAGKTTAIRMILRLIRPTGGRVLIFGRELGPHFIEIMRGVGSLVELPAYYPYLSAVKNLEILRLASGRVPEPRIGEVLETVGLGERKFDRVGTYSHGMKQRLGLAIALLSRPRFVLLDEPTNGLDPQGIMHIREVIRDLNRKEGVTFLISSHLLHEVEITSTRVGILKSGRLILQDTMEKILARTVTGVRVTCESPERALSLVRGQPWVREAHPETGGGLRVACEAARFAELNALLVGQGLPVRELSPVRQTLEEFFLAQ